MAIDETVKRLFPISEEFIEDEWILSEDKVEYCVLEDPFLAYEDQRSKDYLLGMRKDGGLVIIRKNNKNGFVSAFNDYHELPPVF